MSNPIGLHWYDNFAAPQYITGEYCIGRGDFGSLSVVIVYASMVSAMVGAASS